ncbi:MAG: flagellar motor switch protein FliG [Treponema sp.]|nr:flagellar motor switch protein FliG [Treponema sp.]
MSKSKSPEPMRDLPGPAARGLAAYQHTISQKGAAQESPPPKFPPQGNGGMSRRRKGPDFIKTDTGSKLIKARFNKTLEKEAETGEEQESKYRRVAKLLILIGSDEAAQILSHLEPAQVEAVSKEIATIRGITPQEAASILKEFRSLLSASYKYSETAAGGIETAREILHTAFGTEKGEALLKRTVPESIKNHFDFLEELPGEQLVLLFKDETPAAEALVLSRLSPKAAAEVLANSQPKRKIELIRRIAHLDKTSPEVLERIAAALKEKVRYLGEAVTMDTGTGIDGLNALTAILKSSDPSFGDRILQELGADDPYLQVDLKERLNTLDDVVKAEDRAIQDKLYAMSDLDIVLLLKSRSEEFTEKILSNISAERRAHIREEAEILGPVRRRDVDRVAKEFLDWFRENREAGRILLIDDEDIVE